MDLLAKYRQAAAAHGEASAEGDARRANRAYDELARIRRELRKAGPAQARKILTLLDDECVHVRLWAAVDALELSPNDGVRVLRTIAAEPISLTQGSAETLLEQWESNTFEMPW